MPHQLNQSEAGGGVSPPTRGDDILNRRRLAAMPTEADPQEVYLRYIQILSVSISYTYIVYL